MRKVCGADFSHTEGLPEKLAVVPWDFEVLQRGNLGEKILH